VPIFLKRSLLLQLFLLPLFDEILMLLLLNLLFFDKIALHFFNFKNLVILHDILITQQLNIVLVQRALLLQVALLEGNVIRSGTEGLLQVLKQLVLLIYHIKPNFFTG